MWINQVCVLAFTTVFGVLIEAASFIPQYEYDAWEYVKMPCNFKCKYGYESDVEGRPICRCRDPCESVRCLGGYKCVVENPTKCNGGQCLPYPLCQAVASSDASTATAAAADADAGATLDRCELPPEIDEHLDRCNRHRVRWYFDKTTQKCKRYFGCPSTGKTNSFSKKRDCKKHCTSQKSNKNKPVAKEPKQLFHIKQGFGSGWQCPKNIPFVMCESNPCDSCKNKNIICVPTFCGKCGALYLNKKTSKPETSCK